MGKAPRNEDGINPWWLMICTKEVLSFMFESGLKCWYKWFKELLKNQIRQSRFLFSLILYVFLFYICKYYHKWMAWDKEQEKVFKF